MVETVRYNIIWHRGGWAVSINGVAYDNSEQFIKDFPEEKYGDVRFKYDRDFSWKEIVDDMKLELEIRLK